MLFFRYICLVRCCAKIRAYIRYGQADKFCVFFGRGKPSGRLIRAAYQSFWRFARVDAVYVGVGAILELELGVYVAPRPSIILSEVNSATSNSTRRSTKQQYFALLFTVTRPVRQQWMETACDERLKCETQQLAGQFCKLSSPLFFSSGGQILLLTSFTSGWPLVARRVRTLKTDGWSSSEGLACHKGALWRITRVTSSRPGICTKRFFGTCTGR